MTKREVLNYFSDVNDVYNDCTRFDSLSNMIDELLEEQRTVKPKRIKGYSPPTYTLYEYECEKCKSLMLYKQPFCGGCGKAVKWDE